MAGYLRYKIYGKWIFIIAEKKFCYLKNCFDKVETFFLLNSTAMKNFITLKLNKMKISKPQNFNCWSIALFALTIIFTSCQKQEILNEPSPNLQSSNIAGREGEYR